MEKASLPYPCIFHCTECQDCFIGSTGLDRPSLMTVIGNYAWQGHSPGNFPPQVLLRPQSTEGNVGKRVFSLIHFTATWNEHRNSFISREEHKKITCAFPKRL